MGNDSGRFLVLQYVPERQLFEKVHQETFGRTGCRRTIPGQYVASDPRGRAAMVAAIDRQKFIYILNRDPVTSKPTISSPLEAHKANTIVFGVVGVDVGYDNPIFACLEVEYGDLDDGIMNDASKKLSPDELIGKAAPQKTVTFYEVDLGLNHASRKWLEVVSQSAHHLVSVPGGIDGPGGVLVCSENKISWHNQGFDPVSVKFPCREVSSGRPLIISSSSLVRAKNVFFFLLQTEEGDLFKLSIDYSAEGVERLRVRYFDSIAVASSLAVLKSGFLFVPGESANHIVYQIQSLGDYEEEPEWDGSVDEPMQYLPRPLRNLAPIDQMENFAPMTTARLLNPGNEDMSQVYACQGKSMTSALNVIRYGLGVSELARSELPGAPSGVWTLKASLKDSQDSLLVLAFPEATTVLSIGESIDEVSDSGFLPDVTTLAAFQLSNDAYVQVYPQGVRQISATHGYSEWKCPGSGHIVHCAYNERQLVVYLSNHSLVYFELDFQGNLSERKALDELPESLTCMYLGPVPHERQRSRFLAIGSTEGVARIVSLDPDDCLEPISLQALAAAPSSIVLTSHSEDFGLTLDVGLENGVLVSLRVDSLSGALSDPQSRFIGSRPLKLQRILVEGEQAVLAVSSRAWLKYTHRGSSRMSPLFCDVFNACAPFASDQSNSGVVTLVENSLRIIFLENLDNLFNRHRVPVGATPKKLAYHPELKLFALGQSDPESLAQDEIVELSARLDRTVEELIEANMSFTGPYWSSSVEIFDPFKGTVVARLQLDPDEACFSVTFINFYENPKDHLVAVGTAKGFQSAPRSAASCSIDLYRLNTKSGSLELVHKTPVDFIPSALTQFGGRLLAGVGGLLRLYDIGQKRLLRKCEIKLPTFIVSIQTQGWRIVAGDAHESVFFIQYRHEENQFVLFSDEPQPRPISTTCLLDYDTVATADRFGTFAVLRLPAAVSEAVEADGTVLSAKRDTLFGSGNPLEKQAEFYLGDTIVSLSKAALVHGSREVIQYSTVSGSIGIFVPFASRNDALLVQNLEMFMRAEAPALIAGRDHQSYRSSYNPVKSVIDGDLCEQFMRLSADRKLAAAQILDVSPEEILRKLQSIRSSVGF